MNLLHMKYAVVVAETNSINKAAEKLFVGQPNLSRAIKELESNLGITLFERKAKGMFLTPDGEVFIRYAKNVLIEKTKTSWGNLCDSYKHAIDAENVENLELIRFSGKAVSPDVEDVKLNNVKLVKRSLNHLRICIYF